MPVFSLLIAHYNNFEYFKKCYESLLAQTYSSIEVIILDDCSTDGSLQKIQELIQNNTRISIFVNEENKGVGFTKRKLISLANGEICGFLDPDDALTENAVELSVKALCDNEAVASYSRLYICDQDMNVQKIFSNTRNVIDNDPVFLNVNFEVAHFFCFKKAYYLKTNGIDINYKVAEDQDLILKMYEQGSFAYIPEPLYYYRVHKKGLSHDESRIKSRQEIWHNVLKSALERRCVKKIFGKEVEQIANIPVFIHKKENTFTAKLLKKISW